MTLAGAAREPVPLMRRWLRPLAADAGPDLAGWALCFEAPEDAEPGASIALLRIDGVPATALLGLRIGDMRSTRFAMGSLRDQRGERTTAGEMVQAIAQMSHLPGLTVDVASLRIALGQVHVELELATLDEDALRPVAVRVLST